MEEERLQKQLFLRKEILEKGYDTDLYQNHLNEIKENGKKNI